MHIIIRRCGPRLALTISSHLIPQRKVRSAERSTCERSRARDFRTRKQYKQTSRHLSLVFPLVEVSIGTRKPCGLPPIIDSILHLSDHCLAETGPRNLLRGGSKCISGRIPLAIKMSASLEKMLEPKDAHFQEKASAILKGHLTARRRHLCA